MAVMINGIAVIQPTRNTAISMTLDPSDYRINITDTSAVRTITIPAGVVLTIGKTYEIVDAGFAAGLNNVIFDTAGAELINGVASISGITMNGGTGKIVADGTSWIATEF